MNDFSAHAQLIVKDGITYPYARYTHPLKQKDIQIIYDSMLKDNNVKALVIFGSTVNMLCHSDSDIDIYVELLDNDKPPKIPDNVASQVDLIYNISKTSSFYRVINKEGIMLFNKGGELNV